MTISCTNFGECNDEFDGLTCHTGKKLCVSCTGDKINVQAHSIPNHCFTAASQGASSRTIDFSVDFNPDAFEAVPTNGVETIQKIENTVLDEQSEFDSKLCEIPAREIDIPAASSFVKNSGLVSNNIVGVALTGASIYRCTSETFYDALNPKAYGTKSSQAAMILDLCLGSSDSDSAYHYYTYSPCMHNPTVAPSSN